MPSARTRDPDEDNPCRQPVPLRHFAQQSVAFRPDGTTATTTSAGGKPLWRGGHVALVR